VHNSHIQQILYAYTSLSNDFFFGKMSEFHLNQQEYNIQVD